MSTAMLPSFPSSQNKIRHIRTHRARSEKRAGGGGYPVIQRQGLHCFGAANGQLNAKRGPALFAGRFFRTAFGTALLWCALFFALGTVPEAAAQNNGIAPPSAQTVDEPASGNFMNAAVTFTGSWAPSGQSNGVTVSRLSSGSNTAALNTDGFCFPGITTGDYYLQTGQLIVITGQTSQDIENSLVTICQDNDDEPDETFTIQWAAVNNTQIFNSSLTHCESNGYQCNTTFTIRDVNPTAVALARVGAGAATEGGKIEFTVTLGRALVAGEIIDAPLAIGGTGVTTADWSLAKKSSATNTGVSLQDTGTATPKVRFSGAGAQTATLELTATADGAPEGGSETFSIALGSDTDFDATSLGTNVGGGADPDGSANAFSVTVNDLVPDPTITISADAVSVQEGAAASFTVNASPAPGANLDVNLAVSQSGDFVASGNRGTKTVRINANATSATYSVPTVNDNVDEPNGSVTVAVSPGNNYTVGSSSSASVTVTDNDAAPTNVRLSVDDSSVAEDDGATTITVTATVQGQTRFGVAKTVAVSVAGSGGANVVDFTAAPSSFDITIAAGAQTGTRSFALTPTNDNIDENNETITVSGSVSGASTQSATITLADDDAAPTNVRLSVNDSSVAEDDGATTITVTATVQGQTRFGVAKTVAVSVAGSGGANVVDFTASPSSFDITIAAGAQTGTRSFALTPTNDNVDENNETITVSGSVSGASTQSATITLADDDAAPTNVRLSVDDSSVAEDDGATTITVTATVQGQTRFGVAKTVAVSVAGSGGANVVDFTASPTSFDITIAAGAQTGTASFTLTPTNDNVDENNETITVSGSVSGASTQSATITLTDDDAPPATPVATFASPSATAAESAGTQNVTINLSPAPSANITLNYSLSGTATRGADYTISGVTSNNGSISVSGGDTSVNIPVAIADDNADEPNETLILTLTNGTGYDVGGANAHTLTITDNDDPPPATPVASVASASATAAESAGTQNVTINLNPAPSANITVNYSLSGTATRGADYTISGVTSSNGSISVSGGDTSVNIPVAITDDNADEPNETLILTLTSGSGYDIGGANAHTLTITDNDDAGGGGGGGGTGGGGGGGTGGGGGNDPSEVTLSVAPNPVVEGEEITVTVSLSRLVSSAVTIPLVLNAGTAEAGDYGALPSIVVEANQPSGTGMIATTKDDDKDDETFTIALGTLPAGFAAGAQATAQVTITDATATSIESPGEEIPTAFALEQNYPNPFNPTTTIAFALDKTQHVTLAVYDLLGQEVQVLVDGIRPAARYRIPFDAADLASGTYLYVLRTEEQVAVKTMALLK